MRWINKPRKKTRREIVLEYIKFIKIMGYYDSLTHFMYSLARRKCVIAYSDNGFKKKYSLSDVISHNQVMINYFECILSTCGSSISRWVIKEHFICRPLQSKLHGYMEVEALTNLLMSYFKDKHIDNCIIVDN